jgi:diaminohydroxyphosphoribosylaminopyrimidine deaminase/5-amino-6-(5-phosphoribosylamino)uracil reductase
VSAFLRERLLDRLQITVAPMLIGSGRASVMLPTIDSLEHALRPRMRRFTLGSDVMFECVFED